MFQCSSQKLYEKASRLVSGQAGEEETDTRHVDDGLTTGRKAFVIPAEPPRAAEPREGALDHPAAREHRKTRLKAQISEAIREIALQVTPPGRDDLQLESETLTRPDTQRTRVALVGPDVLQAGKRRAQRSY